MNQALELIAHEIGVETLKEDGFETVYELDVKALKYALEKAYQAGRFSVTPIPSTVQH